MSSPALVGGYLPTAKMGHGNYVYTYSTNAINWFGVSVVTGSDGQGLINTGSNISVRQTYNIDAKIDDGLPLSGNVQAVYEISGGTTITNASNTTTSGGNATSCYDTTTGTYSITYNNGSGGNCALSFKMQ
jgi:hypothetical protein